MNRNPVVSLILCLGIVACSPEPSPTEASAGGDTPALASAVTYVARNLGKLPGQKAGGSASDINDFRHVVGTTVFGADLARAFLWKNGVMTNLGTLGGSWSTAAGINNAGEVVGTSTRSDGKLRAFRWADGKMTGLGTLGGSRSEATGINNQGHVVGWSYLKGDPRLDPELEPIAHAFSGATERWSISVRSVAPRVVRPPSTTWDTWSGSAGRREGRPTRSSGRTAS